jgi:hypothetical protein
MAVYDSPKFSVGNPGTGSGATESAAGYKMLQQAMKSAEGIGMRIDEENKAKGTMELLKMKKDGKNITQSDFDRVGRYDPLMLEKKLEKLRKYDRDVVTQDRNYGIDSMKANLYKENVMSQIASRDPEKKFMWDVARANAGLGKTGSGKKGGGKGKAGYKATDPMAYLTNYLKERQAEGSMDSDNMVNMAKKLRKRSNDPRVWGSMLDSTYNDDSVFDYFFGMDGTTFGDQIDDDKKWAQTILNQRKLDGVGK